MRYGQAHAGRAGFSLVEILLVIVIILMLAAALVVFVLPQQEGARLDTTRLELQQLEQALTLYRTHLGSFPTEEQGLMALLKKPEFENEALGERWAGPYLTRGSTLEDSWGRPIVYRRNDPALTGTSDGPGYQILSLGADGQKGTDDDIKLYDDDPLDEPGGSLPGTGGAGAPLAPPAGAEN